MTFASSTEFAFPPDIEAELVFVPTEQGGRKTPVATGYRPQFHYDGSDWDASHEYPDKEWVAPGETVRAFLRFISPQAHIGRVFPGMEFQVREGARVVAQGRIIAILHLEESAARVKATRPS
ncbi:EF-Tu C-terminal domain-related protein [Planctomicrobium piriforme]|uniref:EF-Tu C-terminal domain-related protein n=1 Tax=Planctomicrobium piriforme TaxID=1576369 RepID=UPI000B870EB7|nr:elongation factor Tu [Planctomicrobium piriforme]